MKNKKLIYKNNIKKNYFNISTNIKLKKKYSNILKNIFDNLDIAKNTFHCLSKKYEFNFKKKDLSKFKKFKTVVIIGMGGSILGSEALYCFLNKKIKKDFLFLNDIDHNKLKMLKNNKDLNKILFIVISKSGSTIETLSNFISLKIAKKNSKNIIIISEKNNNPLYLLAKELNLYYIKNKDYIGGRYSVLSEVGMVPAYLMGLDISKIRKNLQKHFQHQNKNFLKESSIILSNLLQNNKLKNIIFFNYVPELEQFLYWAQQLIAESLGKKSKGFLPTISKAPKDHHSLLQLYLDGPKDKLFYIFNEKTKFEKKEKMKIKKIGSKIDFLHNKTLNQIKDAQKNAFIKVLKQKNIPFREFTIKDLDEETIGEFFSYLMLETAIVGKLANINPFNQPAVEQVKIYTKKLLS